jgi:hypothetical protein
MISGQFYFSHPMPLCRKKGACLCCKFQSVQNVSSCVRPFHQFVCNIFMSSNKLLALVHSNSVM